MNNFSGKRFLPTLSKALTLLAIFIIVISGIRVGAAQSDDETVTLRCAIEPVLQTNPLGAESGSWKVLGLIYQGATMRNPNTGEIIPYIAVGAANESTDTSSLSWGDCNVGNFGYSPKDTWADSEKPEIILFYDFEDVYWHDGVQMSVRDVMFSFHVHALSGSEPLGNPLKDRGGETGGNYTETHWLFIEKVWESQDSTRAALRFVLQKPLYSVFENFISQYILPYHIWGSTVSNQFVDAVTIWCDPDYNRSEPDSWKGWAADRYLNANPVGTGQFIWSGAAKDTITLTAWSGHFYRPGFKYFSSSYGIPVGPLIDSIVLTKYSSETRAIMDLELDRIDLIAWNVDPSAANTYANDLDVNVVQLRGLKMEYLAFNMRDGSFGYFRDRTQIAPVTVDVGKPLRRAVAHCVDTSAIAVQTSIVEINTGQFNTFADWENSTVLAHTFDPPEGANILGKAGFILTNASEPAGLDNWWLNPDGSSIGRSPEGKIVLLIPSAEENLQAYSIGTALAAQMRDMGLNTEAIFLESELLEQRIIQGDFDICMVSQDFPELYRERPETFLYNALHTMSIYKAQNFIGYSNASFDATLESALAASDHTEAGHIRDAFASIAFDIPYFEMYYPSGIEITRADNFVGFVDDGSGSLLNPTSMSSVWTESRGALRARFVSVPLTATANSTFPIRVRVLDQNGDPVMGASVTLECTSGNLSVYTGLTDENGHLTLNYTAPPVPASVRNGTVVILSIQSVFKEGYRTTQNRLTSLTVYPGETMLLFVDATALQDVVTASDVSGTAGFTYIDIRVTDSANLPVSDVTVMIELAGAPMTAEFYTGITNSEGTLRVKITAQDVEKVSDCTITITASKVAFVSGSRQISVTVMPPTEALVIEEPGIGAWVYVAVPVLVVAIAGIIYIYRKRK
ncbi:MAG: Ig-like domain-containing protein [Candidatus Thermoplasmatota archaeon]|nr:hypothetical protein [Euryarchaeota archaeon]MBU4032895.1 Ig-like domain-containing protein [Candidatus Thermoplasmatota archaeon]MBU4071945.1 Ig-like domain-containing protein [Candidatus Thermoplasmatota archaeon]MBU4143460.1 Ig-like domain-containing protein [Candidatus Thermoplasmatota archaeon]MBU4591449.1 Ig-like domain-containing protein [Candidatus Thermoplasmatota archaeon]